MFVSSVPSCLCFPRPPTLFFKDPDFLIKYPFIHVKSLHYFLSMFLSGDSQEDTNGASSSSFFILFSSPVDSIQALSIISVLASNVFSCLCTSYSFTSRYLIVPECWRYLWRFVFPLRINSNYFEVVTSFKPFNSTGAISFSSNHFNGVSFEWALTHRSFPRILPDSSIFPELS